MYRNKKSGLLGSAITIIILILIVIFSNREANTSFFENIANKFNEIKYDCFEKNGKDEICWEERKNCIAFMCSARIKAIRI